MTPIEKHLLERARASERIVTVMLGAIFGAEHETVTQWRTVIAAREAEVEKLTTPLWRRLLRKLVTG